MKSNILITDKLLNDYTNIFKEKFSIDCLWKMNSNINFNKYTGIVVTGGFKTNKRFLSNFKNLKIVSVFGVGYDGVDIEYCKNNNIIVTNTPNVLTDDVADLALGLMISLSRKIVLGHEYTYQKKWMQKPFNLTQSLTNKTIGIVGMGAIGKAFSKRAESLLMNIVYHGPNKKKVKYKYYKNLKQMAKAIDIMVITCIGGKSTKNIINKEIISSLKKSSLIINVSRGSVIDEKYLLHALNKNTITGAALDVFDSEPKINKKFFKLKNVILSPHNASGTIETRLKMAIMSCDNLYSFVKYSKVKNKVTIKK